MMKSKGPFPKIGILGGGQLGKMICIAAAPLHLEVHILDEDNNFPAAPYATKFHKGSFKDEADVLRFGRAMDIVTVEIESVHTDALRLLRDEGIKVYPDPDLLDLIRDKGLQKQRYEQLGLPTSPFRLYDSKNDLVLAIHLGKESLPVVMKTRTGGYDGRGVCIVKQLTDLDDMPNVPCLAENLIPFESELAVVVARNASGQCVSFDPVSMVFHPTANLVEMLQCPANVGDQTIKSARKLAEKVANELGIVGLLAVELFLTTKGEILINEVAPRPHNSGHHSIEACITSQFEQHLRAILDWPLGDTTLVKPAVMVNILGAQGHNGPPTYQGLQDCLALPGVHLHLYGKPETRPFRKMGHATITGNSMAEAIKNANLVQEKLKVVSS
jgi:5-(carboxyamino)imidazole ribonucleotide synthase